MFNKITESKIKAGGLPTMKEEEGVSNIKLSFATTIKGSATKIAGPLRSALLGAEDDDETDTKKRALIPLNYSDDEDDDRDGAKGSGKSKGKSKMSSSERDKKEKALLNLVPTKREAIWSYELDWSTLPEVRL
jgi:RNA-binding protein 25